MAFVYPYDLHVHTDRASHLRPRHMYSALSDVLNGELISCLGKNRFRGDSIKNISSLYMESINRPLRIQKIMEGKIDLNSDYKILRSLKDNGVKLAIYYRDAYWAGDLYKQHMPILSPELIRGLYRQDWEFIKEVFDVIYLPSVEMAKYMGESRVEQYKQLLPGCTISTESVETQQEQYQTSDKLKLLYVGGINPPFNDIARMLKVYGDKPGVEIVLCVRKADMIKHQKTYNEFNYKNVRLEVNKSGIELERIYKECDAALLVYPDHPYRKIAMPYKAFEAFGYGLPVIASSGTVFSGFVTMHALGLVGHLEELANNPVDTKNVLNGLTQNVYDYALSNTWQHRALQVVHDIGASGELVSPSQE